MYACLAAHPKCQALTSKRKRNEKDAAHSSAGYIVTCEQGFLTELSLKIVSNISTLSILMEISPEESLEGQMLKLKLQYSGHLMRRTDSLEKTLTLGKMEGGRRRGQQRTRWLDGHEFEQAPGVGDGQGGLACCSPWGDKELATAKRLNWY